MIYNKYDVQSDLNYIYDELDDALNKALEIMDTTVSDLDKLVNGDKGIIDLIHEAMNDIEKLKNDCEDLPEEVDE